MESIVSDEWPALDTFLSIRKASASMRPICVQKVKRAKGVVNKYLRRTPDIHPCKLQPQTHELYLVVAPIDVWWDLSGLVQL